MVLRLECSMSMVRFMQIKLLKSSEMERGTRLTMDSNLIEKNIIDSSRKFGAKNKCTMFGINLGVELNQKLTDYAKRTGVSKAAVVKQLLIAFLKEK